MTRIGLPLWRMGAYETETRVRAPLPGLQSFRARATSSPVARSTSGSEEHGAESNDYQGGNDNYRDDCKTSNCDSRKGVLHHNTQLCENLEAETAPFGRSVGCRTTGRAAPPEFFPEMSWVCAELLLAENVAKLQLFTSSGRRRVLALFVRTLSVWRVTLLLVRRSCFRSEHARMKCS